MTVKGLENGFYLAPCILANVTREMTVYHEEIFGSVMLIIPFEYDEVPFVREKVTFFRKLLKWPTIPNLD